MRASEATLHALQHQLDVLETAINSVYDEPEAFAVVFTPAGANRPLPPLPDALHPDLEATLDEDLAVWDKKRPKERGLLDAGEAG